MLFLFRMAHDMYRAFAELPPNLCGGQVRSEVDWLQRRSEALSMASASAREGTNETAQLWERGN
jgi:hypothetical protein